MTEQFRKVETLKFSYFCNDIASITGRDKELIVVTGVLNVPEARALRDWLNLTLPDTLAVDQVQAYVQEMIETLRRNASVAEEGVSLLERAADALAFLLADNRRLFEALKRYGQHDHTCDQAPHHLYDRGLDESVLSPPCTCGLDLILLPPASGRMLGKTGDTGIAGGVPIAAPAPSEEVDLCRASAENDKQAP